MKTMKRLPLNGLEKFMLAHESNVVSYNSQIVVEFDGVLNPEHFKKIIKKAVNDIPWLRTKTSENFFRFDRHVVQAADVDLERTLVVYDAPLTQTQLDQFCGTKFDIKNANTFRFAIAPLEGSRTQLIFNIHHSMCDAAGQFLLLEEFFRLLNNRPVRDEARKTKTFRYRNLLGIMGAKWFFSNLWSNRQGLKGQRKYKMASLIDHPTHTGRSVSSLNFKLNEDNKTHIREMCKSQKVSSIEYLTLVSFLAYDMVLRERGDYKTPIMAYVPKTLRPFLKIRYSFQNILSTVVVVGKRDNIGQLNFLEKIKHTIQTHKMDQAAKFIFASLLPCTFVTPKRLKAYFTKLDTDPNSITSSMLISAGKVPRSYTFPENWQDVSIWARGTMLKSPGIGIIYTGVSENETITLEFVKELTERGTIESLKEQILKILETREDKKLKSNISEEASSQALQIKPENEAEILK